MTKKFYETDEFLKLQKDWYDKLEEDGFEDCEYTNPKTGEVGNLMKGTSFSSLAAAFRTMPGSFVKSTPKGNTSDNEDVTSPRAQRFATEAFFDKQDYFRFAGQFYWQLQKKHRTPENVLRSHIWKMVADGHSVFFISKAMGRSYSSTKRIVDELHVEFREYLDKELDNESEL